ncbi:hypothetical protein NUACC26_087960 [Scytonema sp. NUACC26]
MKVKGIKRGQIIKLLEPVENIPALHTKAFIAV